MYNKIQIEHMLRMLECQIINAESPNPLSIPEGLSDKEAKRWAADNDEEAARSILNLLNMAETIKGCNAQIPSALSHWLLDQFIINFDGLNKSPIVKEAKKIDRKIVDRDIGSIGRKSTRKTMFRQRVEAIVYGYYDEIENLEQVNKKYVEQIFDFQNHNFQTPLSEYLYGKMLAHYCLNNTKLASKTPPKVGDIQRYFEVIHCKDEKTIRNWFSECAIDKTIAEHKPDFRFVRNLVDADEYTDVVPV